MFEALSVIERCFAEDQPFDHDGRHFTYGEINVTTKPAQDRVPISFGGVGPKNVARAAQRGYHLLAISPEYEPALRAAGRDVDAHRVGLPQFVHLAESRDQAWNEAQHGLHWTCSFYRQAGIDGWEARQLRATCPSCPLPRS